jgi:hypothetical protein
VLTDIPEAEVDLDIDMGDIRLKEVQTAICKFKRDRDE